MRLCELLPGLPEDVIRCRLRTVPVKAAPKYQALSYCWGSEENPQTIFIGDEVLQVTQNLRSLLRHLRSSSEVLTLWIDAVCINQSDLDEKNWQLQLMPDLYRGSTRTAIWIGGTSAWSHSGLHISRILGQADMLQTTDAAKVIDGNKGQRRFAEGCLSPESGPDFNTDFLALLRRPWFTRVWQIQEAILAPDSILHVGLDSVDWTTFKRAVHYGFKHNLLISRSDRADYVNRIENAYTFVPTRRDHETNNPAYILQSYLMDHRYRQSKYPVDKVFALLGLVHGVEDIGIQADYRLTTEEAYHNTAVQILTRVGNLDLLGAAGMQPFATSSPSWVADWRSDSIVAEPLGHARGEIAATMGSSKTIFTNDGSIMVLRGHSFGRIESVSVVLPFLAFADMAKVDSTTDRVENIMFNKGYQPDVDDKVKTASSLKQALNITTTRLVKTRNALLEWERFAGVNKSQSSTARAEYWKTLCTEYYIDGDRQLTESEFIAWYDSFSSHRRLAKMPLVGGSKATVTLGQLWKSNASRFPEVLRFAFGRVLAKVNGRLALVPHHAVVGDDILLCQGARVPLAARLDGTNYVLLGEAYVNGIMDENAFKEANCQDLYFK